jgi:hypothetical protein
MSIKPAPPNRSRPPRHRAAGRPVRERRRPRNRLTVVICAVLAIVLLVVGAPWVLHHMRSVRATTGVAAVPVPRVTAPETLEAPVAAPPPSAPSELAAAFEQLNDATGAQIGLAFAPVDNPDRVSTLGRWSTGPAWSTIKVPLSLALLRQDGTGEVTEAMRSAITASDNGAAEQIWEALGAHQSAAAKVQSVLADAGQPIPQVQSEVTRPGFSSFGQTQWSLADQVRFLAYAACDARDTPVLDLMGDVVSSQSWGLGTVDGAKFKGGWGPGRDGLYLVRQYGLVSTGNGRLAVAIATVAESGGFGDGTAVLSRMATWLQDHFTSLGGGECRDG